MTAEKNEISKQILLISSKLSVIDQIKDVQKLLRDFKKEKEVKKFINSKLKAQEFKSE